MHFRVHTLTHIDDSFNHSLQLCVWQCSFAYVEESSAFLSFSLSRAPSPFLCARCWAKNVHSVQSQNQLTVHNNETISNYYLLLLLLFRFGQFIDSRTHFISIHHTIFVCMYYTYIVSNSKYESEPKSAQNGFSHKQPQFVRMFLLLLLFLFRCCMLMHQRSIMYRL